MVCTIQEQKEGLPVVSHLDENDCQVIIHYLRDLEEEIRAMMGIVSLYQNGLWEQEISRLIKELRHDARHRNEP